jgi:predicted RNA polymerase sigma factor
MADKNMSTFAPSIQRTLDAVWRIESARIMATLAKVTGDVGLAEDLAQEALIDALTQWPGSGVPDNPGAWLTSSSGKDGSGQNS